MSTKDLKDLDEGLSLYITNEESRTLYKQESSNAIEEMHRIDGLLQLPEENFEENMHKDFLIAWEREKQEMYTFNARVFHNDPENFDSLDIYTHELRDIPEFLQETVYPTGRDQIRLLEEYKRRAEIHEAWRRKAKIAFDLQQEQDRILQTTERRKYRMEVVNRKRKTREANIKASSAYERKRKYMAKVRQICQLERESLARSLGINEEDLQYEENDHSNFLGPMSDDFDTKLFAPRKLYKYITYNHIQI
jgi:hypothetical protein